MNGKIHNSVGFTNVSGAIRQLTIREQLIRNSQFAGINEIVHPIHGRLVIPDKTNAHLLTFDEGQLIRLKLHRLTDEI